MTFIVRFGQTPPPLGLAEVFRQPEASQKHEPLTPNETRYYVTKVGQYPAWSIEVPKAMRERLGDNTDLYRRGLTSESQGYGIAAYAYYRRILESVVDSILGELADLLTDEGERKGYLEALEKVKDSNVASEKIGVVRDLLPANLIQGGINPLRILHEALSVGLHEWDEEVCLAHAEAIRTSLVRVIDYIRAEKEEAARYAQDIRKVKNKLDRIRQKEAKQSRDKKA